MLPAWHCGPSRRADHLTAVKGFCTTCGRRTFDTADAMHGFKSIATKPMPGRLGREMFQEQFDLARTELVRERYENVGMANVAIIFEDFVLKDQMIAEGIPGQV